MGKAQGQGRGGYQRREGTNDAPKQMTTEQFETAFKTFVDDLNRYKSQVVAVLPPTTSFQRFRAVIVMAIRRTPKLLECTPTSLINACIHAAHDGLLPDGRLAVIVPVWNNTTRVNEASYRSMVAGVIEQMIATGRVTKVQPFVVYQGEDFEILGGSEPSIYHKIEPDGSKRGAIVGVYAIAALKEGGGSTFQYMTKEQVEEIRKTAQTDKVWTAHWEEMALKTVIRRLRKRIPGMQELPDIDQALTYPSIAGERRAPALGDAPARPTRGQFLEHAGGEAGVAMDFGGGWSDQMEPAEAAANQEAGNGAQQRAEPNNEQAANGGNQNDDKQPKTEQKKPKAEPTMTIGEWRDGLLKEIAAMTDPEHLNGRWEEERERLEAATADVRREVEDAFQDRLGDLLAGDTGGGAGPSTGQS